MDQHQLAIVRLAWARRLGLEDGALTESGVHSAPNSSTVHFLRLGDVSTLVAPPHLADRAQERSLEAFADPGALLALVDDLSARCTGPTALFFATDYPETDPDAGHDEREPLVSDEPEHALVVAGRCPPDDVAEAALVDGSRLFTLLDDEEQPVSVASYGEFEGLVADFGALTVPELRRAGHATTIGRIATDDAMDGGLVPQFRVHRDNSGGRGLASSLGYHEAGLHTSMNVQPPAA